MILHEKGYYPSILLDGSETISPKVILCSGDSRYIYTDMDCGYLITPLATSQKTDQEVVLGQIPSQHSASSLLGTAIRELRPFLLDMSGMILVY